MPLKLLLKFQSSTPIKISSLKPKIIHGIFFSLLGEEAGEKFHSPILKPFSLFFPSYFKNGDKEVKIFP
jgi:CRISPR-associated endoribonuclease Cas6